MKRKILFAILTVFIAVNVFSQSQNLQSAATVNLIRTEAITVGQLRAEVQRMETAAGRALTQAERRQVLDVMINERLVLQAAERDRVIVTDNEVNQQMQQFRTSMTQSLGRSPTEAEFAQAVMNESGLDVNGFREQLRKQMITQKYLMTKKGDMINTVPDPTDAEIQREFSLRRASLVRPETVEFDGIRIPFGQDAASRTNARQLGERLAREIGSNPSTFDSVGGRAQVPNSGYTYFRDGSVPRIPEADTSFGRDFMNTAFTLRQGEVSRLIESTDSYLIIKVTRNLEFKALELHDDVPSYMLPSLGIDPRNSVSVKNLLGVMLASQRQQSIVNQASQELVTELRANRSFQVFENNLNW